MRLPRRILISAVCACLTLALALPLGASAAKPKAGQLDRSFGTKGKVIGFVPRPASELALDPIARSHRTDLALGPDGTIVVATGNTIAEFGPNGRPLLDFGERGRVTVSVPGEGFELAGIAIDEEGRVLVAGTTIPAPGQGMVGAGYQRSIVPSRAAVLRYTPAGTLDPSFGVGGAFVSDLGAPHPTEKSRSPEESPRFKDLPGNEFIYPQASVHLTGIALDGSERPVLSGYWISGTTSCYSSYSVLYRLALSARLDQSGRLDQSFGAAGLSAAPGQPLVAEHVGPEVSVDPLPLGDQTLLTVVSGECTRGGGQSVTLDLLGEHGEANTGFGTGGKLALGLEESGSPLTALDPRGRILFAEAYEQSYGNGEFRIRRYLPDGRLQANLGRKKAFASGAALGVDAHSRPLLLTRVPPPRELGSYRRLWKLERLKASGAVDRRFGNGGATTIGFGGLANVTTSAIAVDARGRIVGAGYREVKDRPGLSGFVLARFLSR